MIDAAVCASAVEMGPEASWKSGIDMDYSAGKARLRRIVVTHELLPLALLLLPFLRALPSSIFPRLLLGKRCR